MDFVKKRSYKMKRKNSRNKSQKLPKNPHQVPSYMRETVADFQRKSMLNASECSQVHKERSDIIERVSTKGYKLRSRQHINQGSYPNISVDEKDLMKDEFEIPRFAWKGKISKLRKHLDKEKNHQLVNIQDACGRTALHFAASWGCERSLEQLLRVPDIDPNLQDDEGKTPLFKAIEIGSLKCVRLLVQHGADATISAHHHSNPLDYLLLEKGDKAIDIIQYLYEHLGMKELRTSDGIMSYLHIIGLANQNAPVIKVAQFLIESGEDINATEGSGKTPLMIAVMNNKCYLAQQLILSGADLAHKDLGDRCALAHSEGCRFYDEKLFGMKFFPNCHGNDVASEERLI